ncbi:uncharacterized protein [Dysidea avara]|uniref:uncharacterized protein isoform X2 n=1 Tax=Dysidea avara TaxID=196820 RepID=UPI00332755A8
MTGSNKWLCPKCNCHRDSEKRMEIWKLPQILVIVLKRFDYRHQRRYKISEYVHYPIKGLNMSRYVVGDDSPNEYHLYAITNHTETSHRGHYTACCQYPYNENKFYKFDDENVSEIGINELQDILSEEK